MKGFQQNGVTSGICRVKLRDSSTGGAKTGLTEASAGLIIATIAENEATTTRYRAGSSEIETIATLGTFAAPTSGKCRFKEVDVTNHPGLYEIQIADARYAVSGARSLIVSVQATGIVGQDAEMQLVGINVNATAWAVNLTQILGAAITGTAAQIVAAFTKWFNVASPTGTVNSIPDAVAGAASGLAIVGSNVGAATSVSGAVGSVTGNVGGNVVGSIGSLATQAKADVNAEADTALADYDGPTKAEMDAAVALLATAATLALVKAKTDLIPASPAAVGDVPTAAQNADKLLGRTRAGGADGGRTVAQALAPLRNKVAMTAIDESAGTATMTVYEDDDVTPLYTYAVSLTTLAKSMTALDPAS